MWSVEAPFPDGYIHPPRDERSLDEEARGCSEKTSVILSHSQVLVGLDMFTRDLNDLK